MSARDAPGSFSPFLSVFVLFSLCRVLVLCCSCGGCGWAVVVYRGLWGDVMLCEAKISSFFLFKIYKKIAKIMENLSK